MADINKTIKDLDEQIAWIQDNDFHKFPGWGHAVLEMKDALELLKSQHEEIERLKQEKLINVDKLREKLGFAESCEKCKKDSWKCQRDYYFSEKDFCERLDIAIEELTKDGEQE